MSCDWPIDRSFFPDLGSGDPDPADIAARDAAAALAVQVLWALSGHQFGACSYIVRPCPPPLPGRLWRGSTTPYYSLWWDGAHYQTWGCGCTTRCRESSPAAVHLPGPAQEVIEVTIADTVLTESQYVLEGDVLHRIGGIWPGQDLGQPIGQPGAWSVEYTRGNPVPQGVDRLTGLLAKEFLAAAAGDKCRLDPRITQVTRRGLSYQIYNPDQIYALGKTGIRDVDQWLAAVNPHQLMCAPSVI